MRLFESYDEWYNSITDNGNSPLTEEFIVEKLNVLQDTTSNSTKDFIMRYGSEHLESLISFFTLALEEIRKRKEV